MAKKTPNQLTKNQLKHVFHHYVSHTENIREIPKLFENNKNQFYEWLSIAPPWHFWYELPFNVVLVIFLKTIGIWEQFVEAGKQLDPYEAILNIPEIEEEPSDGKVTQYDDEDRANLISVMMAVFGNIRSIQIYSKLLNDLLRDGEESDEALLNAILIDRSIVSSPTASRRIQYAVATNDEPFLTALSKAIKNERPRKISKDLDDIRFVFAVLEETGDLGNLPVDELYEIVTSELHAYPGIAGSTHERFKKFYYRHMRSRT